ncbi:hypothetical protein RhiJN_08143 [Ceratobasidium sp. AG-Ba]|nr:hypothetical protein RhiJN_08143 [Ceratobasidium sp. AG-Ba]QRW08928.1 hypothetical protein RhiLY_07927 [Ceratobasidium sp. AG-Ba]
MHIKTLTVVALFLGLTIASPVLPQNDEGLKVAQAQFEKPQLEKRDIPPRTFTLTFPTTTYTVTVPGYTPSFSEPTPTFSLPNFSFPRAIQATISVSAGLFPSLTDIPSGSISVPTATVSSSAPGK